jgi:hypothetical protein
MPLGDWAVELLHMPVSVMYVEQFECQCEGSEAVCRADRR